MNSRLIVLLIALSLPTCLLGQTATPAENQQSLSSFVGVWRGQLDNLPAVDLVITDEGGELQGGILFHLHLRQDVNSPIISKPGLPEPMFNMQLEGTSLSFQVSHKRAHPPGSLNDPPVPFRLKIVGPGRATLENERESSGPPLVMTRSDY